eukprot:Gregarina_sp_Poly_1__2571@NODE_1699_length_3519_cov_153_114137_g590_i1_p4_GENE_NODE_1699_length_3519_cov_153_114137_g590_i1NODE_1699_length_3519_cov_153_114137_g590_i1_p4_ORF_typecomplete_len169_score15_89VanZ/PF04892_12/2_3e16_NODE_1699_length_3519_cov_153_114137_g590_i1275781
MPGGIVHRKLFSCCSAPRVSRTALYKVAAVVWAAFIFVGSTDLLSAANTARVFQPISPTPLSHWCLRKTGHIIEFAVLYALVLLALSPRPGDELPRYHYQKRRLAALLSLVYAILDELHQCYVPTRTGQIKDVCIDAIGIFGAFIISRFLMDMDQIPKKKDSRILDSR